jgi:hypothetical protein
MLAHYFFCFIQEQNRTNKQTNEQTGLRLPSYAAASLGKAMIATAALHYRAIVDGVNSKYYQKKYTFMPHSSTTNKPVYRQHLVSLTKFTNQCQCQRQDLNYSRTDQRCLPLSLMHSLI